MFYSIHIFPDTFEYLPTNVHCVLISRSKPINFLLNQQKYFRAIERCQRIAIGTYKAIYLFEILKYHFRGETCEILCYLINMDSHRVSQTLVVFHFRHHLAVNLRHVTLRFNSTSLDQCYPPLPITYTYIFIYLYSLIETNLSIILYQDFPTPEQLLSPHFSRTSSPF